jgi:superfamily II DNA or RNA helicase
VIWDECHHIVAKTFLRVLSAYPKAIHLGLTATPERSDGKALGDVFEAMVVGASVKELTELGFLVPCRVYGPNEPVDTLSADPVDAYRGGHAVVFCTNVPHARQVAASFVARGISATCVDGRMATPEREARLAAFSRGDIRVMTNVFILTEGWDVPRVDECILARGCVHAGTYLQMVGRVLRPSEGKAHATLVDLRGRVHVHGMPDADREYSLTGKAIREAEKSKPLRQCEECGAVFVAKPKCPGCGAEVEPPAPPAVVARPIVKIASPLFSREEQWEFFQSLVRTQRQRGYKPGWIGMQFKSRYGMWPQWGIGRVA